ncbi:Acetyltransferase YpeA [compost metagenome]
MNQNETLHNIEITIRELVPEDAAALLQLQLALDHESSYMMLEPGERQSDANRTRETISGFASDPYGRSILLGAEAGGELAGYVSARGGNANRNRHSAYLVLGVRNDFQGRGIGGALLRRLETWAAEAGLVRLELTVMTHNERAVSLYRKHGFDIEGTKLRSLRVDGNWVNEYYMGKIIADT